MEFSWLSLRHTSSSFCIASTSSCRKSSILPSGLTLRVNDWMDERSRSTSRCATSRSLRRDASDIACERSYTRHKNRPRLTRPVESVDDTRHYTRHRPKTDTGNPLGLLGSTETQKIGLHMLLLWQLNNMFLHSDTLPDCGRQTRYFFIISFQCVTLQ